MELTIEIKIRYDEVDKMGYVYHGNYAKYFHISRTELLREIGLCDKTLEDLNILLPVIEMNIRYLKPIFYDDVISIKTILTNYNSIKMNFDHLVYDNENILVNKGTSTVVMVNSASRKPVRMPAFMLEKIDA